MLFLCGGWQSLPSRSSLHITLGPSAYGYGRTVKLLEPPPRKSRSPQWQEPSPTSSNSEIGPTGAPLSFASSGSIRSCGHSVKGVEQRAFYSPSSRRSTIYRRPSAICPGAGLPQPLLSFSPLLPVVFVHSNYPWLTLLTFVARREPSSFPEPSGHFS